MPFPVRVRSRAIHPRSAMRYYSAWLLCALLLLFWSNARSSRYVLSEHSLELATSQLYLDGDQARLGLSIAALLLLWSVAAIAFTPSAAKNGGLRLTAACSGIRRVAEFDPESHLRPPPFFLFSSRS